MASQIKSTGITAKKRAASPSQPTGQWIRAEKRLAIYLRDSFRCVYCCGDLHSADSRDITLDHLTPKADGGSNKETNLVTACRACNCSRQDKPLARFAGPETRKDIKRLTARSLVKYLKLAKALISGETGFEYTLKSI
jgi:5-methylcytosine-specific restriction endonuclease McrA